VITPPLTSENDLVVHDSPPAGVPGAQKSDVLLHTQCATIGCFRRTSRERYAPVSNFCA